MPTIAAVSLRPVTGLLGAPGTSIGVNGPLAPLASRNPRAPVRAGSQVESPTIWPRLLRSRAEVIGAPGARKVVKRPWSSTKPSSVPVVRGSPVTPRIIPRSLMSTSEVPAPPGRSMVTNRPRSQRKPWKRPSGVWYSPTTCAVGQVSNQPGGHRGVLACALHHAQGDLGAIGGHAQRTDEQVLAHAEPATLAAVPGRGPRRIVLVPAAWLFGQVATSQIT